MFESTPLDVVLDFQLSKNIEIGFEDSFQKIENAMILFKTSLEHSKKHNLKENYQIWNTAAFVNKCSYDIKIVVHYLTKEKRDWNRRFFVGEMCLILYESSMDLPELMGKKFELILIKLNKSDEYLVDLKEIRKELNIFKSKHQKSLNKVRNTVAGHKDKDILVQLQTLEILNRSEMIHIAIEFDNILNIAGKFLSKVIEASVEELH